MVDALATKREWFSHTGNGRTTIERLQTFLVNSNTDGFMGLLRTNQAGNDRQRADQKRLCEERLDCGGLLLHVAARCLRHGNPTGEYQPVQVVRELLVLSRSAAENGSTGLITSSVRRNDGPSQGQLPLHLAVQGNDADEAVVKELLGSSGYPEAISHRDAAGRVPLHYAAMWRSKAIMELVCSRQAVLTVDVAYKLPVMAAMFDGAVPSVEMLSALVDKTCKYAGPNELLDRIAMVPFRSEIEACVNMDIKSWLLVFHDAIKQIEVREQVRSADSHRHCP